MLAYSKITVSLYGNQKEIEIMSIKITQELDIRGTRMNKVSFWEIEDILVSKGIDSNKAYNDLADEKEMCYLSNGFISGLQKEENEQGEWHHFFKKEEDGSFEAGKFNFN